jgi:ABC-type transporter Mla subunit MlaD
VSTDNLGQQLVTLLTGGGAAALVGLLIRSIRTMRAGARASIRDVVKDLSAARNAADDRAREAEADLRYFQWLAGGYAYQLRDHGIAPDPATPTPPSAQKARRRARHPED